jgi:hypothetical protein
MLAMHMSMYLMYQSVLCYGSILIQYICFNFASTSWQKIPIQKEKSKHIVATLCQDGVMDKY